MSVSTVNELLLKSSIKINPIDSETFVSENDLNGLHIVISWNPEEMTLTVKSNILAIDDLYDSVFQKFQKNILLLNSLDYLPEDFRIGISLIDTAVQIKCASRIDQYSDGESAKISHMIKAVIYYGLESKKKLIEEYYQLVQE